jgi:hypothetical protein
VNRIIGKNFAAQFARHGTAPEPFIRDVWLGMGSKKAIRVTDAGVNLSRRARLN